MKSNIAPIMGIIRLLVSLIWTAASIAGLFYGDQALQHSQNYLDRNLNSMTDNLEIITALLNETGDVLQASDESLGTVQNAVVDVTFTLTDARPLIDETTQVITQDVPEAIEGVQASMPSLIETAAAVDETLTFLSAIQLTIPNFFGDDWKIGLGVDYDPEVPLDQALDDLSGNLEDIPDNLRGMGDDLNTASMNILTLRDDLSVLADDLYEVNQQVEDLQPQIDELAENLMETQTSLQRIQEKYIDLLPKIRLIYMVFFSFILFSQLPSAYIGLMLIRSQPEPE